MVSFLSADESGRHLTIKTKYKQMKKLTIIIYLFFIPLQFGWSNQDPLYTQFMTNPYLINPALTGTYPYYQIITNNRLQWSKLESPVTNTLSMYGPMINQPMGIGGYILLDKFGPESKTSFSATYAYYYGLTENLKLSLGLMLGAFQHKIDGGSLNIENLNDPIFKEGQVYKNFKPDASFGVLVYETQYHGGIAVTNLFGNKLKFEETDSTASESRLKQHLYIHGGYKYFVNREIAVEPTIIFRKVSATPLQMDFSVRASYGKRAWKGNKFWGGISFRTNDAVSILVGFIYQRKIEIGYSYDIGVSKTRTFHAGSHELMITYRFNNIKEYGR